jgi:hypothetical protein
LTAQKFCPHLGTCGEDGTRSEAQDYPSFENQCFAIEFIDPLADGLESQDQLLLTDQATYCLSSSHRLCPRFRLLLGGLNPPTSDHVPGFEGDATEAADNIPPQSDGALSPYLDPELLDELSYDYDQSAEQGPRLGIWMGAATLLFVFLLCGGSLAAYAGWQLVGRGLVPISERLTEMGAPPQQNQIFLLVTPTPASVAQASILPTATATATPAFSFPSAVTPTPNTGDPQTNPVVITTPTSAAPPIDDSGEVPSDPALATAVAGPVVITTPGNLSVPTRRPTPTFEVPTSTPGTPAVIVVTATPTPVYPDPIIEFRSAHQALTPDSCTTLYWKVENVRAVFLDNEGVFGQGERRVCIRSASETYTLSVLLMDGTQEDHTVTVNLTLYTPTPTPTPSYTPVLTPTPTWTPEGGTPVPSAVPPQHGVALIADGGNQRNCPVGQRCEVIIQVMNTGDLADEIFVDLAKDGPWPVQICRSDGSCAETSISVGVGPGNQLPIFVQVDVPADSSGQSYTFQIVGTSGNSNRTVRSELLAVTFYAQ